MPEIPTRTSGAPAPGAFISPERASVEGREIAKAGERTVQVGLAIEDMVQREKRAERAEKALRIENEMVRDFQTLAESYDGRIDYESFETDANIAIDKFRTKYADTVGQDRELELQVGRIFGQRQAQFMQMVGHKKRSVLVERALGERKTAERQDLESYSRATNLEERDIIREQYFLRTDEHVATGIISKAQGEADKERFTNNAEKARADRMIYEFPELAVKLLPAKTGEFDLTPEDRQVRIERADRAAKIEKQARASRRAEALEQERKQEQQLWGNLFIEKKWPELLASVHASKTATGTEKRTWATAANNGSKPIKEDDYDAAYLSDMKVMINTQPEEVDRLDDLYGHVGKGSKKEGLTADQAEALEKTLDERLKENNLPKQKRFNQATDMLAGFKTNDLYDSEDEYENIKIYQDTVDALEQWQEANPEGDPVEWVQENVKAPVEEGWLRSIIGRWSTQLVDIPSLEAAESKPEDKRARAIAELQAKGLEVNEKWIKQVEDQL